MITQTFQSDPLQYFLPCSSSVGSGAFGDGHNEYLCAYPRQWRHTVTDWAGIGVQDDGDIRVFAVVEQTAYPGWGVISWLIGGPGGADAGRVRSVRQETWLQNVQGVSLSYMARSRAGYYYTLFGPFAIAYRGWYRYADKGDSLTGPVDGELTGEPFDLSGALAQYTRAVDEPTNVILGKTSSTSRFLTVWDYTTREQVRSHYIGDSPKHIMWEDFNRAYVIGEENTVTLIDYVTGEIFSITKHDFPADALFAYDYRRKMIIVLDPRPDAADGSGQSILLGYTDIPRPTRLSKPIPLRRSRQGETTKFMSRLVGEAGETFASMRVTATVSPAIAAPRHATTLTDFYGTVVFEIDCKEAGNANITLETDL